MKMPDDAGLRMGTARGRWVLLATVLGSSLVMLDGTVVNVALERIGRDLDADFAGLQWIVNAYTLTLAALILLGGALGDRFGRRRVFIVGVVWFAAASLFCALAPTATLLALARALQGIGGALLTPGSLAILEASFTPADRARAIGAWSGLGGVAIAAGPLVGGYLISAASWRWIFLINVPIAAVVVALGAAHPRLGGQQRPSQVRRPAGVRRAVGAVRHNRPGLPAPGRAGRRIQDRGAHLGRAVRRGRPAGRGRDHQPPRRSRTDGRDRVLPALRARCAAADHQSRYRSTRLTLSPAVRASDQVISR
jgi:MFS family permease